MSKAFIYHQVWKSFVIGKKILYRDKESNFVYLWENSIVNCFCTCNQLRLYLWIKNCLWVLLRPSIETIYRRQAKGAEWERERKIDRIEIFFIHFCLKNSASVLSKTATTTINNKSIECVICVYISIDLLLFIIYSFGRLNWSVCASKIVFKKTE